MLIHHVWEMKSPPSNFVTGGDFNFVDNTDAPPLEISGGDFNL